MDSAKNFGPDKDELLRLYERMLLIRQVEERLSADFHAAKLPGGVHTYVGEEAVAVGVCAHLRDSDTITSTHRGHGHFLAKGGSPGPMIAEIYGRSNGICKGMGGSMHVTDVAKGMLGANGIVGAGLPIATGAAFAAKLDKKRGVSVCFFGDGASNQGVFMEALNISNLWRLPMVFICEHNGFSEFSPSATVTAGEIADRARAFGMPTTIIDGNDLLAVWRAAAEAVERARNDEGPSFIQARTYRLRGHMEAEVHFIKHAYREASEVEAWKKREPIGRLRSWMQSQNLGTDDDFKGIEAAVARTLAEAVAFAEAGEPADPNLAIELMSL